MAAFPPCDDCFAKSLNDSDSEGEFNGFNIESLDGRTDESDCVDFLMDNGEEGDPDDSHLKLSGAPVIKQVKHR